MGARGRGRNGERNTLALGEPLRGGGYATDGESVALVVVVPGVDVRGVRVQVARVVCIVDPRRPQVRVRTLVVQSTRRVIEVAGVDDGEPANLLGTSI